ncbi:beta-ketoacyl-[acyl-carrier-protein] synthase family protein [Streptomyces iconiensis]|uniref:Beta-ketoacyl-[acyl-carrier-protein] synthase family protein n=1 Tax=Streptomyces iconiensis TaxID=1384038 RepID=A0ABT6ZPE6_9ACTN|nr:beta-ketoacyl-[acyl-carrier-protein] synthase family protein [Streptomyces iconiensis]MDJ1130737.1 beta-ketoacyl-[acyl-carrier-protein] synthase family protein [Streptomyces iconiensis]
MEARGHAVVTGIGLVTPGGCDPEVNWKAVAAGRSLAATDPALAGLPVDMSCAVRDFDPVVEFGTRLARRLDPFAHFGLAAARRAVEDARLPLTEATAPRVGVVFGVGGNSLHTYAREFDRLGAARPAAVSPLAVPRSVPNMVAGEVACDLGAQGPNFVVSSACASGAHALAVARDLLLGGACDVVLAGGSESGRAPMTAACFARMRALSTRTRAPELACRPFDSGRDGFVLGEGAAVLVLESPRFAGARGAQRRALLLGAGSSADARHPTSPHPEGAGAELAVRQALADAGCSPRDIGHINAHGTSTPTGDAAEARALLRLFGGAPPPVTATKGVLGHALGASGAIEAALTVLALERQEIPPTANLTDQDPGHELDLVTSHPRECAFGLALSTSFGFGGQNAALVLAAA